ncbi:probable serine/threonine-protein kinase PBL8 isoform X2 [Elaeis guineensis]|uniref:probable serine/threonine-protein kinase PBL8 isoform X2 n=1 Tax=Elaeis guineensis var. tenera TaxID=51953 RepID=UPI003C6D1E82
MGNCCASNAKIFRYPGKYLIGEGGFGHVYKGKMDGVPVAIKKLDITRCQGHMEWEAEIKTLAKFRHPNLVQLKGHCSKFDQRLLVYEYLPLGSLEHHLTAEQCHKLTWARRVSILRDLAKGLAYLHDQQPPMIHRDIKPSNILIDVDYSAKICDFGLARDGPIIGSYVETRVMGTRAYVDPEYYATGKLRTRTDVYSFGMVILEVITGQISEPCDSTNSGSKLLEWARTLKQEQRMLEIMDPRLQGSYHKSAALLLCRLAFACTDNWEPPMRPRMQQIAKTLENLASNCSGQCISWMSTRCPPGI